MSNLEISRAQRLDQKVVELLPQLSRAFAAKLVEQGKVQVNGRVETKAGYKLRAGDTVTVDYALEKERQLPHIDLPVLYEDDDCVVINKPVGVLTHSKGAFNPEATVASWLREHILHHISSISRVRPWKQGVESESNTRAGIVHRLDRATSGVMICAKTPEALSWLQKQFSQRKAKKQYAAVVTGQPQNDEAIIDMPIERHPKKPQTFRVGSNGKTAQTAYLVLQTSADYSLLELAPTTGRTHQLRVHLSHLGHPIVGDTIYGGQAADRLYLHAEKLEITLLSRQRQTFTAPVPESFKTLVQNNG